jgi:phage-related protein
LQKWYIARVSWTVEFLDEKVARADGIARAAYVTATGKRVVIVHVFGKKTQKTPRREIQLALQRAKDVQ